jgi:xylulose-5-phosphate/fructose-6-phosphate phosphoketolase
MITGPGHGAPANLANLWIEGSLGDAHPRMTRDREGLGTLIREFSWPGGFPSHLAPIVPGTIHEGGELGYALATAFGAAFDNPDLIVACVVGDGEAESGPTAGAWHCNKFLDPGGDGAVLPILHVNGYKIANPTISASMSDEEITKLFEGYGWRPTIVSGPDYDAELAKALDEAHAEIKAIQADARGGKRRERPAWPMIVLRSPKGMSGIDTLGGQKITGTRNSHQVPAGNAARNPEELAALEAWLRSYGPEELFDESGAPIPEIMSVVPEGDLRIGSNPHATGGNLRKPLNLPSVDDHALDVQNPGVDTGSALEQTGKYLADVFRMNEKERNFRMFCPDEVASNRLGAVFQATPHNYQWPLPESDQADHAPSGRVLEVLSEHNCQGWMQGYTLTGRHGLFPCYEAFISIVEGMVNQYAKFLKMSRDEAPWRTPVSSLNYILTSVGWRQDHNGYSHQAPGFINAMLNKKEFVARVYLPPDANTMLYTMEHCLNATNCVNVVIASKHPLPQWLNKEDAKQLVEKGMGKLEFASNDEGDPDVVLACSGTIPVIETVAAAWHLRQDLPDLKVRVVIINDLFSMMHPESHPHGMSQEEFTELFTEDRPVITSFHGYPSAIHQLLHHRPNVERFHVRGYAEEGTTTTPFELLTMNGVNRFQLATEALKRTDEQLASQLPTMSGAFAVRMIPGAEDVVKSYDARQKAFRDEIYTKGNDPAEIREWAWS